MVRHDLRRTRGPLFTAGFGIAVGVAALVFFVALGMGARSVLLGEVFPIDQVELEPEKTSAGLISLLGGRHEPKGIETATLDRLRAVPGVREIYPKLRFRFPASARGGKEILGREIGTHEMIGDGIDPSLVPDLPAGTAFADPLASPGAACKSDADCTSPAYCEAPSGAAEGHCSAPVPALVSRYLIELFDHAIAPSHGLPPVAESLVRQAQGIPFEMTLGTSLLGVARQGDVRKVKIVVVGVSPKAIDLGTTLPIDVVRRWNREYAGSGAGDSYSSVVVKVAAPGDASRVIDAGGRLNLVPRDTRARDVSVLISGVMALLVLVAGVILLVAALNIAHTFRVLVAERQHEIGLYRALGATAADMRSWMLALALVVGSVAGTMGAIVARLCAWIADWRAAVDLPDFPFKPESFFGAAGPALRAARTDPARALTRSA
jgi:putative ABC transport system permease protein